MILQIPFSTIHALLEGFSGLTCLLLGVAGLFFISRKFSPPVSRSFFVLTFFVALWLFGFAAGAFATREEDAYFWEANVGYFGAAAISPSILLFVLTFLFKIRSTAYKILIALNYLCAGIFYSLIYTDPEFVSSYMNLLFYGWYPHFHSHYLFFLAYFAVNLGGSIWLLSKTSLGHLHPGEKKQIKYMIAAFSLTCLAVVDMIPGFGYQKLYSFGYLPVLASTGILFATIVNYRFMDIETALRKSEQKLNYIANYDTVTHLPNRSLFQDRLEQTMAMSENYNSRVGLFILDIDQFKRINDSMGHEAGDLILEETAQRLKSCLREGDTLARFGSDEFAAILPNIARVESAANMAEKLLAAMSEPMDIRGHEIFLTTSIGISFFPWDHKRFDQLLKCADIALQLAKKEGRSVYKFFTADMHAAVNENLAMENKLRQALKKNELSVHYQPQISLTTGKLMGAEAVLRWQNPDLGNVSPAQFIPVAEDTALILSIGEWVLRNVCSQIKTWQNQGLPLVRISVNLSGRQLKQPNLVGTLVQIIEETGLNPQYLSLELTESSLVQNVQSTVQLFEKVREMGIHISIDDFGTGYSSLNYLTRFPINTLKIDKTFIKNIHRDDNHSAISGAIIAMAHSLKLKVVAEGVETEEQAKFLKRKKCDAAQGYLYSPPVSPEDFQEYLKEFPPSFKLPLLPVKKSF